MLEIMFSGVEFIATENVDFMARELRTRMKAACDMAGKRSIKNYKRSYSWWSAKVAEAHSKCVQLRRRCTRMRRRHARLMGNAGLTQDDEAQYAEYRRRRDNCGGVSKK